MSAQPMMTVSGIRGIVGESLSPLLLAHIAYVQTRIAKGGVILVGRDTRPTGEMLAKAIFCGIRAAGGTPIDCGIAPTPTMCHATKHRGARGGIIISASHNPNPYNGYKMVHADGRLCNALECTTVYEQYRAGSLPEFTNAQLAEGFADEVYDAAPAHIESICAALDVNLIRNARIRVGIDAINGAASAVFPRLLERLNVSYAGVYCTTSGDFAHNPEPRPEHLTELAQLLADGDDFWAGFGFDPDADRLITMGEKGEPLSEELTLALALKNILAVDKTDVATNLSTSMVIDDVAAEFGVRVWRTKIGEANVVAGMIEHGCKAGGEGNGGVIYPKISTVRDGLAGMAIIIELMAKTKTTLTQIAKTLTQYPLVKKTIDCTGLDPALVLSKLTTIFSNETIDTQDGLKIIRKNGWVHVRASNTEPIMRCYAEAKTKEEALELVNLISTAMR